MWLNAKNHLISAIIEEEVSNRQAIIYCLIGEILCICSTINF